MAKYLDPKADLTFKKVFGEHKDLLMSFLNALLPLPVGEEITSLEYLTPEMVPNNPAKKYSIVDVRCKDNHNRQFIVEMQMCWSPEFIQRTVFNASKAYVRPLDKGEDYDELRSVYSLGIINDISFPDLRDEFYHRYRLINEDHTDYAIDGFEIIFIELPKFRPSNVIDKKMMALWLRFLTEINEKTAVAPKEMLEDENLSKAIGIVEESAYSEPQLMAYDKFWDEISCYRTLMNSSFKQGRAEGIELGETKGRAEGIEIGEAKGRAEERQKAYDEKLAIARSMKAESIPTAVIAKCTGFSELEIESL